MKREGASWYNIRGILYRDEDPVWPKTGSGALNLKRREVF